MVDIPKKLFDKATACGLVCISSDQGNHRIEPNCQGAHWCLSYHKGRWILTTHGVPQMNFQYEEVMKFLDRFSDKALVRG